MTFGKEMKLLLILGFGLSTIYPMAACEPKVENQTTEDVVNDWEDPFSDPEFFDPPNAETISRWRYILRYTELTHARTPLVIDEYGGDDFTRIVVRRISAGKVDLKYIKEIKMELSEPNFPPVWAMSLPESDNVSGLDGTTTIVQVFSGETRRTIRRWAPTHKQKERGLDEFKGWIDLMKRITGIYACQPIGHATQERTEQVSADQPATAVDSKAAGKKQPKPDSDARSQ